MNPIEPDIPDTITLYEKATREPPLGGDDEFVEFLRVMLHRYSDDKSAANCCRPARARSS